MHGSEGTKTFVSLLIQLNISLTIKHTTASGRSTIIAGRTPSEQEQEGSSEGPLLD
jgi:hypothetical protein